MSHLDNFIVDLAMITIACTLVTILFRKLKLPVVLGYIVAGFLISPNFEYLPTIISMDNIDSWANIGIVFLMFALGLEFSFKRLASVGASAIITALTVISAMIVLGSVTGRAMGFERMDSVFLGCMIAISSTMIIMKAYEEYDLKQKNFATLVLGAMVVEDVVAIFIMVILSTVAVGANVSGWDTFLQLTQLILYLVIWMVLGIFLIPTILRALDKYLNDEMLLILSLAICFGMVVIANRIGFSEALGAFMGGSILAGTLKGERIDALVRPLKDLFGAVFFVSVGMLVEPHILVQYIVPILIITAVTVIGQMTFATLGILFSGRDLHTAVRGGFSMVQIGEFSFIIASLGRSLGVIGEHLYPIIVCVSVITICLTPIFIKNSETFYRLIGRMLPDRWKEALGKYTSERTASADTENDWKRFLKRYFTRTLICAGFMFAIYFASVYVLRPAWPAARDSLPVSILLAVVTCLLLLIPASIMVHRRNNIFVKLWVKSRSNRLPLTLLRSGQIILTALFFLLVIRRYLSLPWWMLLILTAIIVWLVVRGDFFRSQAVQIEARFIANVNEKILHKRQEEGGNAQWFGDRLYVAEFILSNPYDIPNVREVYDDRFFDMRAIKIIRGSRHINIPKGSEPIFPGDVVQLIGTKDELDAYLLLLERDENIDTPEQPMVTMKEYLYGQIFHKVDPEDEIIYTAVPVKKGSDFIRKPVRSCGFREKYKGFIVGIERNNYPIVDPSINTVILEGDTLWVVGTAETGRRLIKDDLIQEI